MVKYCKNNKCLVGKTAIITGASAGIGFATALELASRGCRLILACRNPEKATNALNKIVQATGNENVVFREINLESMASVRKFAKDILENEQRLDLLINNAGALYLPDEITEDGLQLEMATNYFSHFLLTNLLLDLLLKTASSRIINVASSVAKFTKKLDLNALHAYGGFSLYCKTKLCNIMFTQELARRLEGTGVTTYSLHPGNIRTEIQRNFSSFGQFGAKLLKRPEEGARTSVYLCLEDGIEQYNGEHFDNCKKVGPYCNARDKEKAQKLWEISESLVGLKST